MRDSARSDVQSEYSVCVPYVPLWFHSASGWSGELDVVERYYRGKKWGMDFHYFFNPLISWLYVSSFSANQYRFQQKILGAYLDKEILEIVSNPTCLTKVCVARCLYTRNCIGFNFRTAPSTQDGCKCELMPNTPALWFTSPQIHEQGSSYWEKIPH